MTQPREEYWAANIGEWRIAKVTDTKQGLRVDFVLVDAIDTHIRARRTGIFSTWITTPELDSALNDPSA